MFEREKMEWMEKVDSRNPSDPKTQIIPAQLYQCLYEVGRTIINVNLLLCYNYLISN